MTRKTGLFHQGDLGPARLLATCVVPKITLTAYQQPSGVWVGYPLGIPSLQWIGGRIHICESPNPPVCAWDTPSLERCHLLPFQPCFRVRRFLISRKYCISEFSFLLHRETHFVVLTGF